MFVSQLLHTLIVIIVAIQITPAVVSYAKPAVQKPKAKTVTAKPKVDPNYQFIRQAYDYQCSGYPIKDVNVIYSYVTEDFTFRDHSGNVGTKSENMSYNYELFKKEEFAHKTINRIITIKRFVLSPTTAVVVQNSKMTLTAEDAQEPGQSETTMADAGDFEDTWVRTTTGWALQKRVGIP